MSHTNVPNERALTVGDVMNGIARQAAEANPTVGGNGLEPKDSRELYLCAVFATQSGLTRIKSVPQAYLCIDQGRALGFSVTQALQSIAVINDKPVVWGDAALALIMGRDDLAEFEESWQGSEDDGTLVAICRVVRERERKGRNPLRIAREDRFSLSDARKANLLGKGPWKEYPRRMLQMRARAFALRNTFPDVLKGIGVAEEVRDTPVDHHTPAALPEAAPTMPVGTSSITKPREQPKAAERDDTIDTTATEIEDSNETPTSNGICKLIGIDGDGNRFAEAERVGPLNWDMAIEYPDGSTFKGRVLCMTPKHAADALQQLAKQDCTIDRERGTFPAEEPKPQGKDVATHLNAATGKDHDPLEPEDDPALTPADRLAELTRLYIAVLNDREPTMHDNLNSDGKLETESEAAVRRFIDSMTDHKADALSDAAYREIAGKLTDLKRPQLFLNR